MLTESRLKVAPRTAEAVPAHVGLNLMTVEIRHAEIAIVVPDDITPAVEELALSPGLERLRQGVPVLCLVRQLGEAEVTMNEIGLRDIVGVANFVFAGFVACDQRSEDLVTRRSVVFVLFSRLTRMEVRGRYDSREVDLL